MKTTLLSIATICALSTLASAQSTNAARTAAQATKLRAQAQTEKQAALALAASKGFAAKRVLPDGTVFELMKLRHGRPAFLRTLGFEGDDTVGADELWSGGTSGLNLSGSGITLGEWDAGRADGNHQEFLSGGVSRITYADTATSIQSHSTHVAGIMAAAGLTYAAKGMAYGAKISTYDWNSDFAEITTAAGAGLIASNHSYGYVCGWSNNFLGDGKWAWLGDPALSSTADWQFGFYSDEARQLDQILVDNPTYLAVWAAGNSRLGGPSLSTQPISHWEWDNLTSTWVLSNAVRNQNGDAKGYDSLTIGPPVAKNDLVVAAVNPISGGYTSPTGVTIAGFSSSGPTDDGRIKPDVASPGVNIYSTLPNNAYGNMSGTSMATPGVTGVIGLLAQQHRQLFNASPLATSMKALLIHTADQVGAAPGPNYRTGWGLVNALSAGRLLSTQASRRDLVYERTLQSGQTFSLPVYSDGSAPLKVTIVWADPAGTVTGPVYNDRTPKLVNDLDLRIKGNGTTYMPWILDPNSPTSAATTGDNFRDNVEQVTIPTPTAGGYTINVSAKNANLQPSGAQNFTLIVTGHAVAKNDATFVSQTVPTSVTPGQKFTASLTFKNTGTTSWVSTSSAGYSIMSMYPDSNTTWGISRVWLPSGVTVAPGASYTFTGTFTAPATAGSYKFQWRMRLSGTAGETFGEYNPTTTIAVSSTAANNSTFVGQTVPTSVAPGQKFTASLTFKNTGTATWVSTSSGGYSIMSVNPDYNTTWGISRVWLPSGVSIAPGQSYTFTGTFTAPATAGSYKFQWRMRLSGTAGETFGEFSPSTTIAVG